MSVTTGVRRLDGMVALRAELPGEPFLDAEVTSDRLAGAWTTGGSTGWLVPSRRVSGRGHLVALGAPEAAARILRAALADGADVGSVSLPRDADQQLPEHRLDPRNDWEWYWTAAAPPPLPGEERVELLTDDDRPAISELLGRASPRHDVRPGEPGVVRWFGIREDAGCLLAAAAHAEHVPLVPHLASIATAPEHRRRGLGAALTAAVTRRCLREGLTPVTLGMYSDNDAARRVYERLGFQCRHRFTSGRLLPR